MGHKLEHATAALQHVFEGAAGGTASLEQGGAVPQAQAQEHDQTRTEELYAQARSGGEEEAVRALMQAEHAAWRK